MLTPVAPFAGELRVGVGGGPGGGGADTSEYKSLFGVPVGRPVITFAVAAEVNALETSAGVAAGLASR